MNLQIQDICIIKLSINTKGMATVKTVWEMQISKYLLRTKDKKKMETGKNEK